MLQSVILGHGHTKRPASADVQYMQVDVTPLASLQKIYCLDLLDCKLSNIEALTSLTGAWPT